MIREFAPVIRPLPHADYDGRVAGNAGHSAALPAHPLHVERKVILLKTCRARAPRKLVTGARPRTHLDPSLRIHRKPDSRAVPVLRRGFLPRWRAPRGTTRPSVVHPGLVVPTHAALQVPLTHQRTQREAMPQTHPRTGEDATKRLS